MKTSAIAILLVAFGIAGGIDMVPQLQQENDALRAKLAAAQAQACRPSMVAEVQQ